MMLDKLMPERLRELFKISKLLSPAGKRLPKHVAVNIAGNIRWSKNGKKEPREGHRKGYETVLKAVEWQVKSNIPIMTLYLMPASMKNSEHLTPFLDEMVRFFETLHNNPLIHDNQIKISVLGKWYDLPGRVVEPIKRSLDTTRDYDRFFLNFCINYDGQEEIVDACKLIVRKIQAGKAGIDDISKELIKENIYSSYFLPPDLYLVFLRKSLQSHLLWDSGKAVIYYSDKLWPDAGPAEFDKGLEFYQKVTP